MHKCQNCYSTEFKDGKCAYCGTDYGFTGDAVLDKWILINKRKRIMEDDGYEFTELEHLSEPIDYGIGNSFASFFTPYGKYLRVSKGQDEINTESNQIEREMDNIWQWYCRVKYSPKIKDVTDPEAKALNTKKWEEYRERRKKKLEQETSYLSLPHSEIKPKTFLSKIFF